MSDEPVLHIEGNLTDPAFVHLAGKRYAHIRSYWRVKRSHKEVLDGTEVTVIDEAEIVRTELME